MEQQVASNQTGYKWSFAAKASKADTDAIRAARKDIEAATLNRARLRDFDDDFDEPSASGSGSGRMQGPTLPSQSDLVIAREDAESQRGKDRELKRKRDRKEEKERVEDAVGPKEVGREGMLEKKRARREADKAFRDRGDEGLEADESTLMGGGDSFRDQCVFSSPPMSWSPLRVQLSRSAETDHDHLFSPFSFWTHSIARRDAAKRRAEEKRFGAREDRDAAARERTEALRQKEAATMDMFKQMAKKFG